MESIDGAGRSGRRPMADNTDARAVRTRQKLVEAFHQAVRDTDPSELSVSNLTKAAGVNRTSFYAHFDSPEDLALAAISELFDVVSAADISLRSGHVVSAGDASRLALERIVAFVDERRASYARLLGPTAPAGLGVAIADAFADRTATTLARMDNRPSDADPVATAHYLAGGVLNLIGHWLAGAWPEWPQERLVGALMLCLPDWITNDRTASPGG